MDSLDLGSQSRTRLLLSGSQVVSHMAYDYGYFPTDSPRPSSAESPDAASPSAATMFGLGLATGAALLAASMLLRK